jgi:hypothetical protein
MFCIVNFGYSQIDEIFLDNDSHSDDTIGVKLMLNNDEIEQYVKSLTHKAGEWVIGGFISSVFHESIDSAKIIFTLDDRKIDNIYSSDGLYSRVGLLKGHVLDITVSHPDFHPFDTTILITDPKIIILSCSLEPKYKILLRGRVFAGNMPLEGVNVDINHEGEHFNMKTRGCFYDKEDYWNCLYDGMFKFDITTDNPDDSVNIYLSMEGMKPLGTSFKINEYQGEVMELKMKYDSDLPVVPINNLNLKLGFPFISFQSDWYVGLSYYRLVNNSKLRRFAYGIDADMYVTTISVSHATFPGLNKAVADSSYKHGFIGPSLLFWMIRPEKRKLSSYAGLTCALDLNNTKLNVQAFLGTRLFLDMNKAICLELRYTEYNADIVHYTFNSYGNAGKYLVSEKLNKLNACLGVQVVF